MTVPFSTFGALAGLALAIVLILRKLPPWLSLLLGALVGGFLGGGLPLPVLRAVALGAWDMLPTVARVLSSGLLAGALLVSGAAERIAGAVTSRFGSRRAVAAIACAAMLICAVGVFVDITIITVAPVALALGKKAGLSRRCILLALVGGGKAGNLLSPNPNTIAAAQGFGLELSAVIGRNLLPAGCMLLVTVLLASRMPRVPASPAAAEKAQSPLRSAAAGPVTVVALLMLGGLVGFPIDPLIVLPLGGLVCLLACGKLSQLKQAAASGLREVRGVCFLLLGTGALAGILGNSNLQQDTIHVMQQLQIPAVFLAPVSGILMAAAAASTTAGTTIAAQTFGPVLLASGTAPLDAAAVIHAGATVLDSLPHGSFFHATAECTGLSFRERLGLVPLEAAIGLTGTLASFFISFL